MQLDQNCTPFSVAVDKQSFLSLQSSTWIFLSAAAAVAALKNNNSIYFLTLSVRI